MRVKLLTAFLAMCSCLAMANLASATEAGSSASAQEPRASAGSADDRTADIGSAARRERAAEILRQMLPPDIAKGMASDKPSAIPFGSEMSRLSFENAYVQLWARPGLTLKQRSLITISILIALGNEHELAVHLASGLRNGLTKAELEEVIYHSSAYAGFPRAADALAIATRVVAQEKPDN